MNMGKTIVEKIIARKVGVPEVKPGEYVKFGIDTVIQVGSDIGALNARAK
jgi:aconitase B